MTFPDRVAKKAATLDIVKLLLTVIASPFYGVGVVLGVLWLMVSWAISACQVGMEDARSKVSRADR